MIQLKKKKVGFLRVIQGGWKHIKLIIIIW